MHMYLEKRISKISEVEPLFNKPVYITKSLV